MKIELIKIKGAPYSIGVGRFCFEVKDGKVVHNEDSRMGCQVMAESGGKNRNAVADYNKAFEDATLAWDMQYFDEIHER